MGDQKRWFKVWCAVLVDPHFAEMALEDIARWMFLGAYMAQNGTRGTLTLPAEARGLCAALRVKGKDELKTAISRLPNVSFEEGNRVNGDFAVTLSNWRRYQEDSTVADRVRALRNKRRGEENKKRIRRDSVGGARKNPSYAPPLETVNGAQPAAAPVEFRIPVSVVAALERAPRLGAVSRLRDPAWWRAELRANEGVKLADEVLKCEAWLTTRGQHRKDLARTLHNWFANADRGEA